MSPRIFRRASAVATLGLLLTLSAPAQTELKPGFNVFSVNQDVEIGRQSAQQVEQQLPLLRDERIEDYVSRISRRLVKNTPGPDFPYQFDIVNSDDINAFALPGGFLYLNRGLLEAADREDELAGVMAHEIAHVALRHGTNQASKAYLAQAGFGILGGLLGDGTTGQIIGAVGGFGLNAVFLKFSRSAEEQADILGAQILARSGYSPMGMVSFFEELRERAGRDPGKVEQFFSSHPAPGDRAERVREEMELMGPLNVRPPEARYDQILARLDGLPDPPKQKQAGDRRESGPVRIEEPSRNYRLHTDRTRQLQIRYPDNWETYESGQDFGITLAPENGIVRDRNGQPNIVYGVIVDDYVYDPDRLHRSGRHSHDEWELREGTEELVHQLLRSNPYLDVERGSLSGERIAGADGLSVVLSGRSPATGVQERVTVATRPFREEGRLLYVLLISPESDYRALRSTFARMISSLRLR